MPLDPIYKSERNFRKYEPTIAKICNTFPTPLTIRFPSGSPVTHATRIADAIRWFLRRGWASLSVDPQQLGQIQTKLTFDANDDGSITARPRTYHRRGLKGTEITTPFTSETTTPDRIQFAGELISPSPLQVMAALNCLELGVVQHPIKLSQLSPDAESTLTDFLTTAMNVVIRKDGQHTILL